ncbi:MAG TPA: tetratricopeptide repeat protein [Stenomitos sp.]
MTHSNGNDEPSIDTIRAQIANIEPIAEQRHAPALAALYVRLAFAYQAQIEEGRCFDLAAARQQTVDCFHRAIALQTQTHQDTDRVHTLNHFGTFYQRQGLLDEALRTHQQALNLAHSGANSLEAAASQVELGRVLTLMGQFPKALRYQQLALKTAQFLGDLPLEASILGHIGDLYTNLGQYSQAIASHQQELLLTRQQDNRDAEMAALRSLDTLYEVLEQRTPTRERFAQTLELSQHRALSRTALLANLGCLHPPEEALALLVQARDGARKMGHGWREAALSVHLGITYVALDQPTPAATEGQVALAIAHRMGARQIETAAQVLLGVVATLQQQYWQAIRYAHLARASAKSIGDRLREGYALMNLGTALSAIGQPQLATNAFHQASDIAQQLSLSPQALLPLIPGGKTDLTSPESRPMLSAKQPAASMPPTDEERSLAALNWAKQSSVHLRTVEILTTLAREALQAHHYSQAIVYAEYALEIAQPMNHPLREYQLLAILGDIYCALEQTEQEINYYQQCLAIAQQVRETKLEAATWQYLGFVYMRANNTSQALRCFQEAHILFKKLGLTDEADLLRQKIDILRRKLQPDDFDQ